MRIPFRKPPKYDPSAEFARSISWAGSKQTFITARLLVDKELVDDCYRAYAYFRWADDVVDAAKGSIRSNHERVAFISRQKALIERLYQGERPENLTCEESLIADLIGHDRGENPGLRSFIHNFLALLEFDANRRGRLISQEALDWYSSCLAKAVTDGILYFIGYDHPYPPGEDRYLAVTGAHITHMLRDMVQDIREGYINIPQEYLEAHALNPAKLDSPALRAWVRDRVELARSHLQDGKAYLDSLSNLRRKIAGHWYCARYEGTLKAIEREGYVLRPAYSEHHRISTLLKMAWLCLYLTVRHILQRDQMGILRVPGKPNLETPQRKI